MSAYEVIVSKIGGSLRVTIPVELTRTLGLRAGDTLLASLEAQGIVFRIPGPKPALGDFHCPHCGKALFEGNVGHGAGGILNLTCPHCGSRSVVEGALS